MVFFLFNVKDVQERDYESYNRSLSWDQSGEDPYNSNRGTAYGESRKDANSYGYGSSYGNQGIARGPESSSSYGRDKNPSKNPVGEEGGGRYSVYPVPGETRNCTGSGCCAPKCYAEKGQRVR